MVDAHVRQGRCLLSVPERMSLAISTFSLIWKSNMPILPVGKAALVRSLAIFASSSQGGCPAILILAKLYQNSPSIPTYVGRTYNLAVNPDVHRDALYLLSRYRLIQAADLRLLMNFSRFIASDLV